MLALRCNSCAYERVFLQDKSCKEAYWIIVWTRFVVVLRLTDLPASSLYIIHLLWISCLLNEGYKQFIVYLFLQSLVICYWFIYLVRHVLFYLHAAIVFDRSKRFYQFHLHCTKSVTNGHLHEFFITTYVVWDKVMFLVVSVILSVGSSPISSGEDLLSPCSPQAKTPPPSHPAPSCPIASQGWSPPPPPGLSTSWIYWQVGGWPSTETFLATAQEHWRMFDSHICSLCKTEWDRQLKATINFFWIFFVLLILSNNWYVNGKTFTMGLEWIAQQQNIMYWIIVIPQLCYSP